MAVGDGPAGNRHLRCAGGHRRPPPREGCHADRRSRSLYRRHPRKRASHRGRRNVHDRIHRRDPERSGCGARARAQLCGIRGAVRWVVRRHAARLRRAALLAQWRPRRADCARRAGRTPLTDADISDPALEPQRRGLWLLDHAERFNILCIPPLSRTSDVGRPLGCCDSLCHAPPCHGDRRSSRGVGISAGYFRDCHRRAGEPNANAALYFPRIKAPDPTAISSRISRLAAPSQASMRASTPPRGLAGACRGGGKGARGAGIERGAYRGEVSALNEASVNARASAARRHRPLGCPHARRRAEPRSRTFGAAVEMFIEASIARGLQIWAEPAMASRYGRRSARASRISCTACSCESVARQQAPRRLLRACDASTMSAQDMVGAFSSVLVGFASHQARSSFVKARSGRAFGGSIDQRSILTVFTKRSSPGGEGEGDDWPIGPTCLLQPSRGRSPPTEHRPRRWLSAWCGSFSSCSRRPAAALSAGAALSFRQSGLDPDAVALGDRRAGRAELRADRPHGAGLPVTVDRLGGRPLLQPSRRRLAGDPRPPR